MEDKTEDATKEDATSEDAGEGSEPTADEKVKQLNEDTERINQAIAENENAKARQRLGGIAEAGSQPVKESEEDKKKAGAKEFFKGTKLEEDIDKL